MIHNYVCTAIAGYSLCSYFIDCLCIVLIYDYYFIGFYVCTYFIFIFHYATMYTHYNVIVCYVHIHLYLIGCYAHVSNGLREKFLMTNIVLLSNCVSCNYCYCNN